MFKVTLPTKVIDLVVALWSVQEIVCFKGFLFFSLSQEPGSLSMLAPHGMRAVSFATAVNSQ